MKIEELLLEMVKKEASDLHLSVGLPPQLRLNGEICTMERDNITPDSIKDLAYSVLTPEQIRTFEQTKELDASFGLKSVSRFRINLYYQRGSIGVAIRRIPYEIPSLEELGLPEKLKDFTNKPNGLFLVTGPAGSGKSTTLASLIEYVNQNRKTRIITIEDPIEYLHKHRKSTIHQRELGGDTLSYGAALKHVVRQDPDIVLIGEMRDLETMQAAITLAETGHLIFSTLHTRSATSSISRIIDSFPARHQDQIRIQLSLVLQGVIVQQLLPLKNGKGRVLAYELMTVLAPIRNLIKENAIGQIYSFLQTGAVYGMCTMNQSLVKLYKEQKVSLEEIKRRSNDLKELQSLI